MITLFQNSMIWSDKKAAYLHIKLYAHSYIMYTYIFKLFQEKHTHSSQSFKRKHSCLKCFHLSKTCHYVTLHSAAHLILSRNNKMLSSLSLNFKPQSTVTRLLMANADGVLCSPQDQHVSHANLNGTCHEHWQQWSSLRTNINGE